MAVLVGGTGGDGARGAEQVSLSQSSPSAPRGLPGGPGLHVPPQVLGRPFLIPCQQLPRVSDAEGQPHLPPWLVACGLAHFSVSTARSRLPVTFCLQFSGGGAYRRDAEGGTCTPGHCPRGHHGRAVLLLPAVPLNVPQCLRPPAAWGSPLGPSTHIPQPSLPSCRPGSVAATRTGWRMALGWEECGSPHSGTQVWVCGARRRRKGQGALI